MRSRLNVGVAFPTLLIILVCAGCGSTSTGPSRPVTPPSTKATARYGLTPDYVSVINLRSRKLAFDNGFSPTLRVTERTTFEGVADFDALVADYAAGYRMYVTGAADAEYASEVNAVLVRVEKKTGPFPTHFRHPARDSHPWAGVPSLLGWFRSVTVMMPWTKVRPDSELATIDDIARAAAAGERVCVAGDGFAVSIYTVEAMTIGGWHYTGEDYQACANK